MLFIWSLYERVEGSEFWVNRLSMERQKSLRFDLKYINLCSEDKHEGD